MFAAMKRVSVVDVMMTAIQLEVKFLKQSKWLKGVHLQLYKNFAFIKCFEGTVEPHIRPVQMVQAPFQKRCRAFTAIGECYK